MDAAENLLLRHDHCYCLESLAIFGYLDSAIRGGLRPLLFLKVYNSDIYRSFERWKR